MGGLLDHLRSVCLRHPQCPSGRARGGCDQGPVCRWVRGMEVILGFSLELVPFQARKHIMPRLSPRPTLVGSSGLQDRARGLRRGAGAREREKDPNARHVQRRGQGVQVELIGRCPERTLEEKKTTRESAVTVHAQETHLLRNPHNHTRQNKRSAASARASGRPEPSASLSPIM